jgi:hypothetical protein
VYQKTEDQVCAIYFPLAKTENELAEARRFVKDRISLISLVPEAEAAVRNGRMTESAAKAIAKLPSAKQRKVLDSTPGNIERRDVVPPAPKAPKPAPKDHELLRRITAVFDDIVGDLLHDEDEQWLEVDRKLLVKLWEYVEEVKAR